MLGSNIVTLYTTTLILHPVPQGSLPASVGAVVGGVLL